MSRSFGDDSSSGGGQRSGYGGSGNGGGGGYRPQFSNQSGGGFGRNKFTGGGKPDHQDGDDNRNGFDNRNGGGNDYDDENNLGANLYDVDYTQVQLKPFQKVFYQVGKSIHTDEEIEKYQKDKGISVRSKHQSVPQPFITWGETKMPKYIMSVIEECKFSDPMPIQAQSFPIVLSGHDLIGIAQTGSGKTLSFILPGLVHINAQDPVVAGEGPIVLVLAPTRELANQIQEQCYKFGSRCKTSSVCVYGGAPRYNQERELRRGCDVVIATPGRLIDFLESNVINLRRVTYLVLDEADRMLDMGFEPSIRKIVGQIRPDRQTLMFSATWPQNVRKLALDFCQANPIHIQIGSMENNVNNDIQQIIEITSKGQKYNRLKEVLQSMDRNDKTIIFTQTKKDCDDLSEALYSEGLRNACIHGDKSQRDRDKVMELFKTGRVNTLIATDVASRGLDVKDIKLVVNFDFPKQIEDYIHRVGRTGRAGATGKALSFLDKYEDKRIAKELVDVLKQNDQEISEELLDLADYRGGSGGFRSSGNSRGGGSNGGSRFTGSGSGNGGGYSNNRPSNGGDRGGDRGFERGGDRSTYSAQGPRPAQSSGGQSNLQPSSSGQGNGEISRRLGFFNRNSIQ